MHILSQVKLFLTFFSVTGRGHISILFLRTGQPVHQTIGAIVATLYTTHSYLSLSRTKTGPTPCKFQSKVCTIERTCTQYLNKFFTSVVFKLAWRHERHVVSVRITYKTKFYLLLLNLNVGTPYFDHCCRPVLNTSISNLAYRPRNISNPLFN